MILRFLKGILMVLGLLVVLGVVGTVFWASEDSQRLAADPSQVSANARPEPEPIPSEALDGIEDELWDWAEGRWGDVRVVREGDYRVVALIEISEQANAVARRSYCRVVSDTVAPYLLAGQSWEAELRVDGSPVASCR